MCRPYSDNSRSFYELAYGGEARPQQRREGLWQGLNAAIGVSDTILKYEDCSGHGILFNQPSDVPHLSGPRRGESLSTLRAAERAPHNPLAALKGNEITECVRQRGRKRFESEGFRHVETGGSCSVDVREGRQSLNGLVDARPA